jgi:hypothetical protein
MKEIPDYRNAAKDFQIAFKVIMTAVLAACVALGLGFALGWVK